ncbi:hypothetical protein [Nitrobacter vulgaris]|uniref:Uncharacterized protein n=1 Tax=Nitrobacter vulgaris TaxID=29421 RepID=A0A1V4HXJ2_NITVU|nr:hypothetical protein [Nitrobacter vulgaris]OPH82711.1 hypothetical protein B2M20_10790 [Nitrobacter vulgaris]
MVSAPGIFFAGIGTAALLIGAGFGGGVLLGKAAVNARPARTAEAQGSLPAARVVLPAMADVTPSSDRPAENIVKSPPPLQVESIPAVAPVQVNDFREQDRESEKQAARKAEKEQKQVAKKAAERERHKRYAAQKARQEAARRQQQQEQELRQQQQEGMGRSQPSSLMAFDRTQGPAEQINFFGR